MKVHEKPNKQICGEVLDMQEESTTEIKHDDGEHDTANCQSPIKRKYNEDQSTQDQSTQDKTPIKRECKYLDVNIRKNMSEKRNGNFIIHDKVCTCCKRMTNKISEYTSTVTRES